MSAQTITIISGVALLVVFALVGWRVRRGGRGRGRAENPETRPGSARGG
jgi:hypothetical protein